MTLDHIYNENCLTALANLPAKTVQMCVTSPPYYGLRDYGTGRWEGGDDNCTHQPADTPQKRGIEGSTLQGGKKHTGHQQEGYAGTFPPDLIIPCIKAGSKPGDIILDPFMGSGTTAEVALRLQRHYIGYEINPQYIQLAEKRLRPHKFNLFTPSTVHPQPSTVE